MIEGAGGVEVPKALFYAKTADIPCDIMLTEEHAAAMSGEQE